MPRLASSSHRFPQYISRLPLSLVLWVGTKYALPRIWSLRIPGVSRPVLVRYLLPTGSLLLAPTDQAR